MKTETKKTAPKRTSRKTAPGFSFPPDTVAFLGELRANNNREWFTANKTRYDLMVKQPALDFCDHIAAALGDLTGLPHGSKVFRVHRDVRFSKDKTPYKAYLHMLFQPSHSATAPKWFFGLEPDKLILGAGIFGFEKSALLDYRQRVVGADGHALHKQLERMRKAGMRTREPELKRVPSGFDPDLPQADLLRHKGLTAWLDMPGGPTDATEPDIVKTSIAGFKKLQPLFNWLNDPDT